MVQDTEMTGEDKEKVNLGESEDFLDSQESVDSFARQVGVVIAEEEMKVKKKKRGEAKG